MKEALKLALEALEQLDGIDTETECVTIDVGNVIAAIEKALAQDELCSSQEPVASPTSPPKEQQSCDKRPWVGLTDEERNYCVETPFVSQQWANIEAKLKELNT